MPEKSLLREYLEALLIAVVFATFARTWVVQAFKIPSGSMEQNLLIGDHILVNKFIYGPVLHPLERRLLPMREVERGDVVVFKFPTDPSRDFIKRCMGLPGDRLRLVDRDLFINGRRVDETGYVFYSATLGTGGVSYYRPGGARRNFGPVEVPEAGYFCLGDNRDNSNDSRFWGSVPAGHVKGRAFLIYWSFDGEAATGEWLGWRRKLGQLGKVARRFIPLTRWERTFRLVR
jgi:signal peptidase I